jgi:hypothetical protein
MKRIRSIIEFRHCSRCRKPLTDPLSWARGTGTDCAGKNDTLFAKTIPANYGLISLNLFRIDPTTLPTEIQESFTKLRDKLIDKGSRALSHATAQDIMDMNVKGQNLNEEVKKIDWYLSFELTQDTRHILIDTVKHMGFIAVAAVMAGQASTGEATVEFDKSTGYLKLTGSRTKQGWAAARKIRGVRMPFGNDRTILIPARNYDYFKTLVYEFWPIVDEEQLQKVMNEVTEWLSTPKVEVTSDKEITEKTCVLTKRSSDFTASFAWIPEITPKIISEIKGINWKDRAFSYESKQWCFKSEHFDEVKEIIGRAYDIVVVESNETTPDTTYNRASSGFYKAHRRYY